MNIDYNDIFVKNMHNKMSKSGEKLVNYVNMSVWVPKYFGYHIYKLIIKI